MGLSALGGRLKPSGASCSRHALKPCIKIRRRAFLHNLNASTVQAMINPGNHRPRAVSVQPRSPLHNAMREDSPFFPTQPTWEGDGQIVLASSEGTGGRLAQLAAANPLLAGLGGLSGSGGKEIGRASCRERV
jgi:hypothetical protein